jgi:ketosteroid isomerase-like protein
MRIFSKPLRLRAALVAASLATACQPRPASLTAGQRTAIVDSVQTMLTAWRDAFNARDFVRAATFYSHDSEFRWYENGELKFRSGAELADTMKAEGSAFRALAMSLVNTQITPLAGGIAEVSTGFDEKITDSTGQTFGIVGAVTMTAVHGDSGWKFLMGHTSIVLPSAGTNAPLRTRKT